MEDIGLISSVGNAMAAESFIFWKQIIDIIQCHSLNWGSVSWDKTFKDITHFRRICLLNELLQWELKRLNPWHNPTVTLSHCIKRCCAGTVRWQSLTCNSSQASLGNIWHSNRYKLSLLMETCTFLNTERQNAFLVKYSHIYSLFHAFPPLPSHLSSQSK